MERWLAGPRSCAPHRPGEYIHCAGVYPDWTSDDARTAARSTAQAIRDLLGVENDLSEAERLVLDYLAKVVDDRRSDKITVPRAPALRSTGLGLTAWRSAIRRLETRDLIHLVEAGRPAGPGAGKRRANVYKVHPPNPKTGLVVWESTLSGAHGELSFGGDAVSGAPSVDAVVAFLKTPQGEDLARKVLAEESDANSSESAND